MYKKGILSIMMLLLLSLMAGAQKYTVSGYVTDAASGEPLIGVAVFDSGSACGTVTGNSGFYSISLDAGEKTLVFNCLGFAEHVEVLNLAGSITMNVKLRESMSELEGAVVTSRINDIGVHGTQMSAIEVPLSQIKTIPAFAGEVDVIKALQLLPGVQSGTEGSAGLYVRGGGADENLLLMDGVPLYNVNHLFGFFSVFNPDAIKNVTLYKGSFPARFGGHLSSVVDIRLNDGNDSEIHGAASIGLISSKFSLEGPIVKGRTTFNISARRTYLDLLAKPALAYVNKENYDDADNFAKYGGGYDFYDLNAKITHHFKNDDRLSLSFYTGDDAASVKMDDAYSYNIVEYDQDGSYRKTDYINKYDQKIKFGWRWGNLVTALRWNHAITPKLYMTAGTSYTQYRSYLSLGMDEISGIYHGSKKMEVEQMSMGLDYNSRINDIAGFVDFEWFPSPDHEVKFGTGYTYHRFKPGIISVAQEYKGTYVPDELKPLSISVGDVPIVSHETALYGEDNWTVAPWLKANLGFRASLYSVGGKTYFSAEPRLSARALLTDRFSIKASYSEMGQYIHLLCNSNLSLPSDLWVPVTERIKPMRSRQVAAGAFYDIKRFEFSIEAYYKTMDNVLEYKDGASYFGVSTGWEDKVCMGRGWAYGVEFFVQKKTGKTTGWIGYTLARSMRQFDRPGNIINDGNPFPAKYDRRHDLSATVTHRFSKRFDLSANFVLSSGNCGSLGLDYYQLRDVTGTGKTAGMNDGWYSSGTYLPNRNNYRMPLYNRMDLGMNFYKEKKHGTSIWNISVYNVYNRLNPFLVIPDEHFEWDDATGEPKTWPVLKQISIFPIIPSVSYTFKF